MLFVVGGNHRPAGRRDYPRYAVFERVAVVCGCRLFYYGCIVQLLQK